MPSRSAPGPVRVLIAHSHYIWPGGEEAALAAESALLRTRGHEVSTYEVRNEAMQTLGALRRAGVTLWNAGAAREIADLIRRKRVDVVHFHNTFPLISPAAHRAAHGAGAAVVQTLHNYRLICPGALLTYGGAPCEACVGRRVALPGVVRRCYRGSAVASAGAAAMVSLHGALGTWRGHVDAYIALSPFARERFLDGGLPADRLHVKPNFVDVDPGVGAHDGDELLFVGRLSAEKGVVTLLEAWRVLDGRVPLAIVGDGPLAGVVRAAAAELPGVRWLGARPREEVLDLMRSARALVLPSLVYENFPLVLAEAYATGLPVIASDAGSLRGLVEHEGTGLRFAPGDAGALAQAARRLHAGPELRSRLGAAARAAYERSYTGVVNYGQLVAIYEAALRARAESGERRRMRWGR